MLNCRLAVEWQTESMTLQGEFMTTQLGYCPSSVSQLSSQTSSLFLSSQDISFSSGHRWWKKSHCRTFKQGVVCTPGSVSLVSVISLFELKTDSLTSTNMTVFFGLLCFRRSWSVCSWQTSQRKLWWVLNPLLVCVLTLCGHSIFVISLMNPDSQLWGTNDTVNTDAWCWCTFIYFMVLIFRNRWEWVRCQLIVY